MSSSTWQQHFHDRLAAFVVPTEGSPLEAALAEGHLEEADYLAWASVTHSVPVILDTYFTENEPESSLLSRRQAKWHATFIPVCEWDGHLTIAALEMPAGELPPKTSIALASREMMGVWWEKLSAHVGDNEGIEGISLSEMPATGDSDPEGLTATMQRTVAPTFSFAGVGLTAAAPDVGLPELTDDTMAPTSHDLPMSDAGFDPATAASATEQDTEATIPFPIAGVRPGPSEFRSPEQITDSRLSAAGEEAILPRIDAQLIPVHGDPGNRPSLLSPLAAAHPHFADEVRRALTAIGSDYDKTMFMALNESRQGLVPLLWSASFGDPPMATGVPLGQSSIFEIVATTEKPFHGAVVDNEINKNFFECWNAGVSPETATLVPFFFQHRFSGMIVAFGPAAAYKLPLLRHVEKVAEELSGQLGGHASELIAA